MSRWRFYPVCCISHTCDKSVHSIVMIACFTCWVAATVSPSAWRQVHKQAGAITSERNTCMQATYASAEVRAKSLAEMQQADAAEAEKLLQRQQAAEAQYDQGLSKLRATARQLQSLASRVCPARPLQCRPHPPASAQASMAQLCSGESVVAWAGPGDWVLRVPVLYLC